MISTRTAAAIALALGLALPACGGVRPISLSDSSVPLESRKLIADTQDTVSIARLDRDAAARALARAEATREDMVVKRNWPDKFKPAIGKLTELEDRRVALAQAELDLANSKLALAEAKYTLLTAQTAMRHDLAVYDLEPLRDAVDAIRADVELQTTSVVAMRDEVDELTTSWWNAYAAYAKEGGTTFTYHQSTADVPVFVPPAPPKEEDEGEEGAGDSAEASSEADEAADALKNLADEKKKEKGDDDKGKKKKK